VQLSRPLLVFETLPLKSFKSFLTAKGCCILDQRQGFLFLLRTNDPFASLAHFLYRFCNSGQANALLDRGLPTPTPGHDVELAHDRWLLMPTRKMAANDKWSSWWASSNFFAASHEKLLTTPTSTPRMTAGRQCHRERWLPLPPVLLVGFADQALGVCAGHI
jgi:hypothetical protein